MHWDNEFLRLENRASTLKREGLCSGKLRSASRNGNGHFSHTRRGTHYIIPSIFLHSLEILVPLRNRKVQNTQVVLIKPVTGLCSSVYSFISKDIGLAVLWNMLHPQYPCLSQYLYSVFLQLPKNSWGTELVHGRRGQIIPAQS